MKSFYIKDYIQKGISHSDSIEKCFAEANKEKGEKTIIFDGMDYFIDKAILLSSDTRVIIDNCTIKQNDYVFDNIFRGDNLLINGIDPYREPLEVYPISNIKIMGTGNAKTVGTDKRRKGYHPFFKEEQEMVGDNWGYRTHMFSFSNCDGIEISGLKLRQTMGWATSFDSCKNGHIHDLDIISNVHTGDGVDIRSGCSYFVVENIRGKTSDDSVACTALSRGKQQREFSRYLSVAEPYNSSHEGINCDIHHIKIRNIKTGGRYHGVICLTAFGNQIHDIEISDIADTGEGDRKSTVMIYTGYGYGDGYKKGDIRDIKINNVISEFSEYALKIECDAENITYENIIQNRPYCEAIFENK